jgi:hypothetical protein
VSFLLLLENIFITTKVLVNDVILVSDDKNFEGRRKVYVWVAPCLVPLCDRCFWIMITVLIKTLLGHFHECQKGTDFSDDC